MSNSLFFKYEKLLMWRLFGEDSKIKYILENKKIYSPGQLRKL
jgi:hypothetical protein